jgi:hypothetical protein
VEQRPRSKTPDPARASFQDVASSFRSKDDAKEFVSMALDEWKGGEELSMSHAEKMDWASSGELLDKTGFSETLLDIAKSWIDLQPKKKLKVGKAFKKYQCFKKELVEQGQRSDRLFEDVQTTGKSTSRTGTGVSTVVATCLPISTPGGP